MKKVTQGQEMDDATRAALASGRAEPALGLFIDSMLEIRGISLEAGEAIAGAALEFEAPATMSPNALDMAFAAIERGGAPKARRPLAYPELAKLPAVLREAIEAAEAGAGWKSGMSGLRQLRLEVGGKERAEIIRIDPGVAIPWHTHRGQELTLCLVGGYSDSLGEYGPGDFCIADPAIRHQPKADDDGVCFVLAVTDAGLKFEGMFGVIQKLTGG